jgi:PAS domain S-box-containing protein
LTTPLPSSSDLDRFSGELQVSRNDSRRPGQTAAGITPRESHAELIAALEELSISEGDLRAQHEVLLDAYQHLEAERDPYDTLFHLAPDPYLVTDQHGTIEQANAAAAELLGVSSTLLEKKSLLAFLDAESRSQFEIRLDRLTKAGHLDKWALAIEARDGRIVPMEVTAAQLGKRSLGWIFRDTGVRRASEESMHALNRSLNARAQRG